MANPFRKISDMFKNLIYTNETRGSGRVYPNPHDHLYRMMQIEMDRKKSYEECWVMYVEDPRIAAAIDTTAGSATNGSFTVQFNEANVKNVKKIVDAEDVINSIKKRAKIDMKINGIAKELLILGDAFLEIIVDPTNNDIVDLKKLPARTIERVEDDYGNLKGFVQKNDLNQEIAKFEPWQILHMRWNHFSGQLYGTSIINSIRKIYKKLKMTEEDLVVRRRTRAGVKLHHYGASHDEPLEEDEMDDYIETNKQTPMNVRTDFYSNGKWKIDVLRSDDGVNEINDIKHFEDSMFIGLRTPKGLLGIGSETNKATLERQEVSYVRLLKEITDIIGEQLKYIFDLGMKLKGLNIDDLEYDLIWDEKSIEDVNRKADRMVLLANGGFVSKQTAVGEMGYNFKDEMAKIEREQKEYSHVDYNPTKFNDPNSIIQSAREKVKHQKRTDDGKENVKTQTGEE